MRQLASLPPKLHLCVLLTLGLGLTLAARAGVFSWPPERLPLALFLLFWGGLAAGDGRQGFQARSFRLTLGPPAIFLAQATNTPLALGDQIALLLIAMVSSKGASGVTGAGFVTLAATIALVPKIPMASLALLVGIDRFMSECRSLTNLIGNGVATLVIARWEKEVSAEQLRERLRSM